MTYLITFLDNKGTSAVYTGEEINVIYIYLEMIGAQTTLNTLDKWYHHFSPSISIKNDTASLNPVIADLRMTQKSICRFFGIIGHKPDAWIISGNTFLPTTLRRNINQFNVLHCEEPNEPARECIIQPTAADFKSSTSTPTLDFF